MLIDLLLLKNYFSVIQAVFSKLIRSLICSSSYLYPHRPDRTFNFTIDMLLKNREWCTSSWSLKLLASIPAAAS